MNIKLQHMIIAGVTLGMAGCLDQGPVADADATAELAEPPAAITQQILARAAASTFHRFQNRLYTQCMDPPGGAFNVILKLATCNFLAEQRWALVAAPAPNTFFLVNQLTGLCAEVNNGTATPGERVDEFTCNGSTAEQWVDNLINFSGTVYHQFQHAGTNQCLDTVGAQDSQLMQFNCDLTMTNRAQQWLAQ